MHLGTPPTDPSPPGNMKKKSLTTPMQLRIAQDTEKALQMRAEGFQLADIGRHLKRSPSWVSKRLTSSAKSMVSGEEADRAKRDIYHRQMDIIKAHYPLRANTKNAKVIQQADLILIKLFGLDEQKVEVSGALTVTDGAVERLLGAVAVIATHGPAGEGDTITLPEGGA